MLLATGRRRKQTQFQNCKQSHGKINGNFISYLGIRIVFFRERFVRHTLLFESAHYSNRFIETRRLFLSLLKISCNACFVCRWCRYVSHVFIHIQYEVQVSTILHSFEPMSFAKQNFVENGCVHSEWVRCISIEIWLVQCVLCS